MNYSPGINSHTSRVLCNKAKPLNLCKLFCSVGLLCFLYPVPLSAQSYGVVNESFQFFAPDGQANDELGHSVAISGNVAAVGAPPALVGGTQKGAVYVYTFQAGAWSFEAKLVAS